MEKKVTNDKKDRILTGFTLIEIVVSIAVFSFMAIIIFQVYSLVINEIKLYRDRSAVAFLANQYIEIARNLPYADIGTIHGSTCDKEEGECSLPDEVSPAVVDFSGVTYEIYYSISYVDDPADGLFPEDVNPNDYKQVKLYVVNTKTEVVESFSTKISPKGRESLGDRGIIQIKVFDAVGQPIKGATINIVNDNFDPIFNVTRTSDENGNWVEIGVDPDVNGYHITVSKTGYSTDQTHPITEINQSPAKPNATVLVGEITEISFSIDLLSSLTFYTLNQSCEIMSGINLALRGSKMIGTSPIIYKFDKIYTSNSSGIIVPTSNACSNDYCLEWDNYTPAITGETYMIYGTSPPLRTSILPNTLQSFSLLIGPKTNHSMLVVVKDSSSGEPIEGALVTLTAPDSSTTSKITGGSVWSQNTWYGGSGQENFENSTKYFQDSGNLSIQEVPSAIRLSEYALSGWLISSSFDTGTDETVYTTLNWQPISQISGVEVKFQIATNNDNETWEFVGPDGTTSSYYDVSGTTISSQNNSSRYIRYKAFLSTEDPNATPVLTGVNINYVSGCNTPGQVIFTNLTATNPNDSQDVYQVDVEKTGYDFESIEKLGVEGYTLLEVLLEE